MSSSLPLNGPYLLSLPPEDLTDVLSAITTLRTKLLPRLADLNTDQIRALAKFGSASVDFSGKTYAYTVANQGMKPGCVDMDLYTQTVNDYNTVVGMMVDIAALYKQGTDSVTALGSQKYGFDRACYQGFQAAANLNVPGANLIVAELAPRFAKPSRKASAAPAAPAAPAAKAAADDKPEPSGDGN